MSTSAIYLEILLLPITTASAVYAQASAELQQCGTVRFRLPAGWVRKDVHKSACTMVPATGGNVAMGVIQGTATPSYRSAFETMLTLAGKGAQPRIEALPGPGYDILRAVIRIEASDGTPVFLTYVAANPYGRLEAIVLMTESERDIKLHWPVFETLRRSLEYLPPDTPLPAPNAYDTAARLFMPRRSPGTLEGLYGGAYLFSRSGAVVVNPTTAVSPDTFGGWRAMIGWTGQLPSDPERFTVNLGTYEIAAGTIRLHYYELKAYSNRQLLACELVPTLDRACQAKTVELPFSASSDYNSIRIGDRAYSRQQDQTGTKLSGDFECFRFVATTTYIGEVRFTSAGEFSINETSDLLQDSGTRGAGRYEIRGNEIVLSFSDGRVQRRLFGDLGRDQGGKRRIRLGDWRYTQK